jgi:hypothetical protein
MKLVLAILSIVAAFFGMIYLVERSHKTRTKVYSEREKRMRANMNAAGIDPNVLQFRKQR